MAKRNSKTKGSTGDPPVLAGDSPGSPTSLPSSSAAGQPGRASHESNASQAMGSIEPNPSSSPGNEVAAIHGAGTSSFPPLPSVKVSPRDLLLSYQAKWVDDSARFKIGLMARQVGKDFSAGCEGVTDCYVQEMNGGKTTWLIAAPSERQSIESLEKWKEWTEAYKFAIADIATEREDPRNSESLVKSTTIVFPGGSRIIAVPGRPDTVRGFSANVLATEFAFFDDPDKTWRALLPSITNPLRGGLKKVRLISTPNGIGNKFHDLWAKNYQVPGSKWSCHKTTITDAVAAGLPIDVEELRSALDDPEGWAQEYDPLDFLDVATVLLPYDLIVPCENPLATASAPAGFWDSRHSAEPIDLGIDFGRKKDLTVSWALQTIGGVFRMTREVLELAKLPTPEQINILRPRIARARRVAFDYTGPGVGMGDYLVKEFGEYDPAAHRFGKIQLCTFTNNLKVDIFPKTRMAFESKTLGIPVSRVIREDLHSINRVALAGGGVTYRAPHTDDGHADRCTALALALHACAQGGGALSSTAGIHTGNRPAGRPVFTPRRLPV